MSAFRVERLATHERKDFRCGVPIVDEWFHTTAGHYIAGGPTIVHVVIDSAVERIAAFFALSEYSVRIVNPPALDGREPPPRIDIPVYLLDWFGVDMTYQGMGLGGALVSFALRLAGELSAESQSLGVVIRASNAKLAGWYQRLGFEPFPHHPLHLVMDINTIINLP